MINLNSNRRCSAPLIVCIVTQVRNIVRVIFCFNSASDNWRKSVRRRGGHTKSSPIISSRVRSCARYTDQTRVYRRALWIASVDSPRTTPLRGVLDED